MKRIKWNGWFAAAAANAFLAVIANAFGNEIVNPELNPQGLFLYHQAADFHISHSIAILGAAVLFGLANKLNQKLAERAATLLQTGIILYSGSLYWHASSVPVADADFWLFAVVGGVLLITGWLYLSYASYRILWCQNDRRSRTP